MSKSNGIETTKSHGQKIMSSYPQETLKEHKLPDTRGGKMGGSVENLSHSLKGTSAVQD